jgi:hypothetical protein
MCYFQQSRRERNKNEDTISIIRGSWLHVPSFAFPNSDGNLVSSRTFVRSYFPQLVNGYKEILYYRLTLKVVGSMWLWPPLFNKTVTNRRRFSTKGMCDSSHKRRPITNICNIFGQCEYLGKLKALSDNTNWVAAAQHCLTFYLSITRYKPLNWLTPQRTVNTFFDTVNTHGNIISL